MQVTQDIILKLLLSVLVGGIIGAEREYRSKSAGFRTMILICLGSTLFTLFSLELGKNSSPERIAANIVVGIGFVGAGVIFRGDNRVNGITTAATIWVTAALGMGIGAGHEWIALSGCGLVLLVLLAFTFFENRIAKVNQLRNYMIVCRFENQTLDHYEQLMKDHHLTFKRSTQHKTEDMITGNWLVHGSDANHRKFIEYILNDQKVKEFQF